MSQKICQSCKSVPAQSGQNCVVGNLNCDFKMICNACQQKLDIQHCDFCQQARPTPGKRSVTINVVAAGPFADEIAQLLGREADPATPLWLGNQSVTITVNAPNSSSTKNVKLVCANAADRGSPLEEQIVNGVNKLQKDSPNPQEPV